MNLPTLNKEKESDNKIEMAQTACPAPGGSSFVTTPNEQERVNYAKASMTLEARAIHTQKIQQRRCIYCGQVASLVWVHGHGQCAACGINVDECCRGESCFNNEE